MQAQVGQNSDQTRSIEAAYHMPYYNGRHSFEWPANTSKPGFYNGDAVTMLAMKPYDDTSIVVVFNTDPFIMDVPSDDVGDTRYMLNVYGAGLWFWQCNVAVTALDSVTQYVRVAGQGSGWWPLNGLVDDDIPGEPKGADIAYGSITGNTSVVTDDFLSLPRAATIALGTPTLLEVAADDSVTFQFGGIHSWNGQTINGREAESLSLPLEKVDSGGNPDGTFGLGVTVEVILCRFSPVGQYRRGAAS